MTATDFATYAKQTAADNDCDVQAAIRMMADEPGEVARDLGVDAEAVQSWCRSQVNE